MNKSTEQRDKIGRGRSLGDMAWVDQPSKKMVRSMIGGTYFFGPFVSYVPVERERDASSITVVKWPRKATSVGKS